jgi:predicted component of type VI protein secretion system
MKKIASSIEKDIEKILNCENLYKPKKRRSIIDCKQTRKGNKQ